MGIWIGSGEFSREFYDIKEIFLDLIGEEIGAGVTGKGGEDDF